MRNVQRVAQAAGNFDEKGQRTDGGLKGKAQGRLNPKPKTLKAGWWRQGCANKGREEGALGALAELPNASKASLLPKYSIPPTAQNPSSPGVTRIEPRRNEPSGKAKAKAKARQSRLWLKAQSRKGGKGGPKEFIKAHGQRLKGRWQQVKVGKGGPKEFIRGR